MGRDYLKVGYYTERFFAGREMYAISQSMTEWTVQRAIMILPLSEICSMIFTPKIPVKKVRAIKKAQGMAGEHLCTKPPYGYKERPNDKRNGL